MRPALMTPTNGTGLTTQQVKHRRSYFVKFRMRCWVAGLLLTCGAMDSFACTMMGDNCVSTRGRTAYVWANNPAAREYTPQPAYTRNDGPVTIRRVRAGFYNIALETIADNGGNAQVTAYGDAAHCQVASWRRGIVNVACFGPDARPRDARFSLLFIKDGPQAYVWANDPIAANYEPSPVYTHWDPAGSRPLITRTGIGAYRVRPGGLGNGGNVQVSAYGGNPAYCNVVRWGGNGVEVQCYSLSDSRPVDSQFTLLFSNASPGIAFAWGDNPSQAEYTANARYAWPDTGIKVMRESAGVYRVRLGETVRRGGGNVQVTTYASEARCNVRQWSGDDVTIACYHRSEPRDTRFSLLYTEAGKGASMLEPARPSTAAPACTSTVKVIGYERIGGIAGYMDRIDIYEDGCYSITTRRGTAVKQLSELQMESLLAWRTRWRSFDAQQSTPPGSSDRMFEHLSFSAVGEEPVRPEVRREIEAWLSELVR